MDWSLYCDGPARTEYQARSGAYVAMAYLDHYSGKYGFAVTASGWFTSNVGHYVTPESWEIAKAQAEHEVALRSA